MRNENRMIFKGSVTRRISNFEWSNECDRTVGYIMTCTVKLFTCILTLPQAKFKYHYFFCLFCIFKILKFDETKKYDCVFLLQMLKK